MTLGRPQKYSPKMIEDAREYIKNYSNFGDIIPSNVGLCRILGISRSTLYLWGSDPEKPGFSDILEEIQTTQHRALLNGGLTGTLNSNIVKLVLGKHGYKEQKDTALSNSDGTPLFDKIKITFVEPDSVDE